MDKRGAFLLVLTFLIALSILMTIPTSYAESTENSWATKTPLPKVEGGLRVAAVNGKIYVMVKDINYEYDPAKDTWTAKNQCRLPETILASQYTKTRFT